MQCNLKKFSTLIVNEYYHRRCYLFNFWNLHLFERQSRKEISMPLHISLAVSMYTRSK